MTPDTFDNPHADGVFVSSSFADLDLRWVTNILLSQYWSTHRTHEQIGECLRNSLCFGLFLRTPTESGHRDEQIGFARVITDYASTSYVLDFVVDEAHRGKHLGARFLDVILCDSRLKRTTFVLRTRTASNFYAKHGFEDVTAMRRLPPKEETQPLANKSPWAETLHP